MFCESCSLPAQAPDQMGTRSLAALAQSKFRGLQFRRQHPLGSYILDFYCPAAKLALEFDGGGHLSSGQPRDRIRDQFFASQGIQIVRFWNHQIREELDSVLTAIWVAIDKR